MGKKIDLGVNSITNLPNISIKSNPRNREKKKLKHEKNRLIRSTLYRAHCDSLGWLKDVSTWHQTLRALSLGTA